MSTQIRKSSNDGRNIGLYNKSIRDTLFFVCQSTEPLSVGQIARHIRADESRYMSNEYKIIKRLCPLPKNLSQFTDIPPTRRYLNISMSVDGSYAYVPNLPGLLVYLYNEYLTMRDTSKNYEKKVERERQHLRPSLIRGNVRFNQKIAKRIRRVLSNPLVIKIAPFLKDWTAFEKYGFNVVELLLNISVELQNQLNIDAYDDTYLLRRATERYYIALENFFFECQLYVSEGNNALEELVNSHRKSILPLIKYLINKETERFDFLEKELVEFEMLRELDTIVLAGKNEIISIYKMAYGYRNIFNDSVSVLEIVKNKRNYVNYLLADSFLIARPLIENVRPLFSNKMSYPNVAKIFDHNNIPRQCISDIMENLGYKEKRARKIHKDDFKTGGYINYIKKSL